MAQRVTDTLQNKAIKMLLCCRDTTLAKDGVQEEIGIAEDLVKELARSDLLFPCDLKNIKSLWHWRVAVCRFCWELGEWSSRSIGSLESQGVPLYGQDHYQPELGNYKKRLAIQVEALPEVLTSNWLRIASLRRSSAITNPLALLITP